MTSSAFGYCALQLTEPLQLKEHNLMLKISIGRYDILKIIETKWNTYPTGLPAFNFGQKGFKINWTLELWDI